MTDTEAARKGFFPNPCPVCGAIDEHEEAMRGLAAASPCTLCPHPREPGHGTGCCCAGRSKPAYDYDGAVEPGTLKEPRSLAERVTMLEEMCAYPLRVFEAPPAEFTAEQEARLRESLDALVRDGKPFEYRILPPAPILTPETARALAREYVTILKPGEVLAIRVPGTWTDQQVHETSVRLDEVIALRNLDITVLLLPGEEFAVATGTAPESSAP